MYLKALDIFGYKSFAAKAHLDFGPRITGVVGPNGCGKSNIMESVRWCLGETSWKSLRAEAMTDVIFSGTARRPALSFCEVALTFDNSSNGLPVPFSEVTVSRRLFRSGESLYFLNKSQCRLKDIRDLFLDTGIGDDGYAIIDQGRIEAMISAKPEELRVFFEEAAGVSRYNARRAEALRKLERVESDISRIRDSRALIEEQVKKLDSDAKKARLFEKYKSELAAAEAAHLIGEIARIEASLQELESRRTPVEESLGRKSVEKDAQGAGIAALNLEKASVQAQAFDFGRKTSDVRSRIARLEERVTAWEREISQVAQGGEAFQTEEALLGERSAALQEELGRARESLGALMESLEACRGEADAGAAGLRGAFSLAAKAQEELDGAVVLVAQASDSVSEARRNISAVESDLAAAKARAGSLLSGHQKDLDALAALESEIAVVAGELAAREEGTRLLKEEDSNAQTALDQKRAEESRLRQEESDLAEALAKAQARLEALEARGGQDPYWVGAQTVLEAGLPGILGSLRSFFEAEDGTRLHLADRLGDKLHAVVCEDSSAARSAIEFLESSGRGRCRFLVLSALPDSLPERSYPDQSRPLLSRVRFDSRHERLARFLLADAYSVGNAVFGDYWVCGGAAPAKADGVSWADAAQLKIETASVGARRDEARARRSAMASEIESSAERVRAAALDLTESLGREKALGAKLAEKKSALSFLRESAAAAKSEAVEDIRRLALILERLSNWRESLGSRCAQEKEAQDRHKALLERWSSAREALAKASAGQDAAASRLKTMEDQESYLKGACERLEKEESAQGESLARLRRAREASSARSRECAAKASEARLELESLYRELAVSENASKAVMERLRDLDLKIAEREKSLLPVQEAVEFLEKELHDLDVEAGVRRGSIESLKSRLQDERRAGYEQYLAEYADQKPDPERLEFLRKRMAHFGQVNTAAPEEYQELVQKQSFLDSQLADVSKAGDDLRQAIRDIDDSTRENFKDAFSGVRDQFRRLYGVLFEGGEADLILTRPDNLLETGVEIVAQPPGKRLQRLSLLSGGEKTLTSIALLFAFFMTRPSPLCMLDEADAALDDANVERFVGLLDQFESKMQFLIASHNRRTMEAAESIYGVTMEEMGVSQIVGVDFKKKPAELPAPPRREIEGELEAVSA